MQIVLLSTYEMGRQPFGLASPAAWLRAAGHTVQCLDLSIQRLDEQAVAEANLIALYVPMHTATRMAAALVPRLRALNPQAHLCCYGLYAPLNADFLHSLGVQTLLGGEFEQGLVDLAGQLASGHNVQRQPLIALARQQFRVPDRSDLPPVARYAHLQLGNERRVAGYTEASRGCKHRCRHCPVVPVYNGRFRVVDAPVVLADVAQQVAAGARHITFGDPDFLNGPTHALNVVTALHARFPNLTYDATIKIEHLLKHAHLLPTLRDTGCVLVTSAVESVDDAVLAKLAKGHTRADFVRAVELTRAAGLALQPTFVAFHPWLTLEAYLDLLELLNTLSLVESVPPIQLAIRLLIPHGSRLLELPEVQTLVQPFDKAALVYPWQHPDARVDALHKQVLALVAAAAERGEARRDTFERLWALACEASGKAATRPVQSQNLLANWPVPTLSEPWYC